MSASAIPVASVNDARSTISSGLNVPPAETRSDCWSPLADGLDGVHATAAVASEARAERRRRVIDRMIGSCDLVPSRANLLASRPTRSGNDVYLQPGHPFVRVVHDRP